MMSPHEKARLLKVIEAIPTSRACIDCVNWRNSICTLAGVMPPGEILEVGCEAWVFDEFSAPF